MLQSSRPLFLRRPPQLRRPSSTTATNLTRQNLQQASTSTTVRPTRISIRKKIVTRTREVTTPSSIYNTTTASSNGKQYDYKSLVVIKLMYVAIFGYPPR